jgi:hypothetical protein
MHPLTRCRRIARRGLAALGGTAVALGVAVTATLPTATAQATPPADVTFSLQGVINGPQTIAGTFTVSGAVSDSGTYTERFRFAGQTAHVTKVLVGGAGTIRIDARAVVVPTGPTTIGFAAGNWVVTGGTGAYAGLHAEGSSTGSADLASGAIEITHSGSAHFE